jgi:hypothetical protein
MIAARGGLQTLREDSLGLMIWKMLILHNYVLCATFNLEIPVRDALTGDYEFETPRPLTANFVIPESPFYCPRRDFMTLRQSSLCKPHTLRLITEIRDYISVIEAESLSTPADNDAIFAHRLVLRTRLLNFPTLSSPNAPASVKNDYIYESIRLTCLILLRLSDTCLPVQIALSKSRATPPTTTSTTSGSTNTTSIPPPSSLVPGLARALRDTPILTGWQDMLGVLSWVSVVGTCAARGKPQFAFLSSVGMRCMLDMCYKDKNWMAAVAPIQRFIWFQKVLLDGRVRPVEDAGETERWRVLQNGGKPVN